MRVPRRAPSISFASIWNEAKKTKLPLINAVRVTSSPRSTSMNKPPGARSRGKRRGGYGLDKHLRLQGRCKGQSVSHQEDFGTAGKGSPARPLRTRPARKSVKEQRLRPRSRVSELLYLSCESLSHQSALWELDKSLQDCASYSDDAAMLLLPYAFSAARKLSFSVVRVLPYCVDLLPVQCLCLRLYSHNGSDFVEVPRSEVVAVHSNVH
jgi:hypothetical protein